MAKKIIKPVNIRAEINAKLTGLYLKALRTKPGTKAQDLVIKEIEALEKLKQKFVAKTGVKKKL